MMWVGTTAFRENIQDPSRSRNNEEEGQIRR
jgi:hypothetical protein